MKRNRIIGSTVVAFAALFTLPAILSPNPENVSRLTVTLEQPSNELASQQSTDLPLTSVKKTEKVQPQKNQSTFELASLETDIPVITDNSAPISLPKVKTNSKKLVKNPPPAVKPKIASPKSESKSQMFQVTSVKNKKNAQSFASDLKKSGFDASTKEVIIDGETYTRVYIGPYKNSKKMESHKAKLKALGYIK